MKRFWIEYVLVWGIAILLYCTLPGGALVGNYLYTYIAQYACIALTLLFIFISLRLFSTEGVKRRIREGGETVYTRFWEIRLALLALPLFLSLAVYEATMESSCGFCALIILFALFFVTPSAKEKDALLKQE
ncbi:MAG: hypothetical protein HUJ98_04145 [Bacteroidaceae bacterium]|nr:hypothetical protein [Bacteroidaceae bacterium]